jgi:DNA-binding HxlR family transcriptional regulator
LQAATISKKSQERVLELLDREDLEVTETPGGRRPGLQLGLERVGDRWALLVVEALLQGPNRYSELKRQLPTIASNVLSGRLRRLEAAGVLQSQRYSDRPPRMEYRLTPSGRALAGVIEELDRWGRADGAEGPAHRRCGTPMELRWYCPTCDELVIPGEAAQDDDVVFA